MFIFIKPSGLDMVAKLTGLTIHDSRDGRGKYLEIEGDPLSPIADIPEIPQEFVEKVTYKGHIDIGFRTEGIYKTNDAVLLVRTYFAGTREYQEIYIRASSVNALQHIYTLVRQGLLFPVENWEQEVTPTASEATSEE